MEIFLFKYNKILHYLNLKYLECEIVQNLRYKDFIY